MPMHEGYEYTQVKPMRHIYINPWPPKGTAETAMRQLYGGFNPALDTNCTGPYASAAEKIL